MLTKHPSQGFLSKVLNATDQGIKMYGTARGAYAVVTSIANAARSAYQIAGPALAMLA